MKTVSVIIPVYGEQDALPHLRNRLTEVLKGIESRGYNWEIVFVDDGSTDATPDILQSMAQQDQRIKVICLVRNFGAHVAIKTGFEFASGDCVINIAADLQEPPELISEMLDSWDGDGFPVVAAVRKKLVGTPLSRVCSRIFYATINVATSIKLPPSGSDMVLLDRTVVNQLLQMHEHNSDTLGQVFWMGFPTKWIQFERQEREHGSSGWTLSKKIKAFIDFLLCFSYLPIRIYSVFGLIVACLGFLWGAVIILNRLLEKNPVQGWPSMMVALLILSGIIILGQGVLGEYIWRTLDEVRHRPSRIIRKTWNIEKQISEET
jgi:dolichol-phosphate mannosyltransferase